MKVSLLWFALISGHCAQLQFATKGYSHGAYVGPWMLEGQKVEMPSELPGSSDYSLFVTDGIGGAAVSAGSLSGYLNVGFQGAVMEVYGPGASAGQIKPLFDTAITKIKEQITKHEQLILESLQEWAPPATAEGSFAEDKTKIPSVQSLFGVSSYAGVALNNFKPKPTYEILSIGNCRFVRFSKVLFGKDSSNVCYFPDFASAQTTYFPGSPVGFSDAGFYDEKMIMKNELEAAEQDVAMVVSEGVFENTPMSLQAIVVNHVFDCMKEDKILDCVKELNVIKRFYRFLIPQWSDEIKKAALLGKIELIQKPSSKIHRLEVHFDQYHDEITKYREAKKKEQASAKPATSSTQIKGNEKSGTANSKTGAGNNKLANSPYAKKNAVANKGSATSFTGKIDKFKKDYVSPYAQKQTGTLQRKGAMKGNLEEDPYACSIEGLKDPSDSLVLEQINSIALDYAFRFNKKCGRGSTGRDLAEELLKCSIQEILSFEFGGPILSECVQKAIQEVFDLSYEPEQKKDEDFGVFLSQAMVYAARSLSKERAFASPYFINLWKFIGKYYSLEEINTYPELMKGKGFDVSMGVSAAILQKSPTKSMSAEDKSQIESEMAIQIGDIERNTKSRVQVLMDLNSLEEKLYTIEQVKGAKSEVTEKLKNKIKAKYEEIHKKKSDIIRKLQVQDPEARARAAATSYREKFFSDYKGEELQYLYKDQHNLNKENTEEFTAYDDHTFTLHLKRRRLSLRKGLAQQQLNALGQAASLLEDDLSRDPDWVYGVHSDDGLVSSNIGVALLNDLRKAGVKLI